MIEPTTPDEDEAFNEIERMAKQRMEAVQAAMQVRKVTPEDVKKIQAPWKTQQQVYDELRNDVIEEVAQHIEKLTGFGQDTISSFAIYIRGMKK
jgi:protein-tyrosine-phosphatase